MGCPDSDNDGIADKDDQCPDLAGNASGMGCPDRDLDSIPDNKDACPDIFGLKSMNGCPDADGDGITDADDACPTVAGTKAFNGCPDTDEDGVADPDDLCPKTPGTIANKGCPEIKEETKKIFEKALTGIQFETGKAIIRKTSYGILNNVAQVMVENPDYFLDIKGHTDNAGDSEKNKILSAERAASVMDYLVSKGIDPERMTAEGFGDTQPVMTNDTKEGRAANRRVEFVVRFEK
jgi:outer membrane protein OmpA-like peptidoglycan-associated protein